MLRKVVLHGNLKKVYAGEIKLEVDTVAEAVRACCHQIPGFKEALKQGHYRVTLGKYKAENDIDLPILGFKLGEISEVHFTPVIEGAKRGGVGKAVLGVAMIGMAFATMGGSMTFGGGAFAIAGSGVSAPAAFVLGSSTLMKFGVALLIGGVTQMLSSEVGSDPVQQERPEQRPSYLFNGPVNTVAQGLPVPLVYGKCLVGSHVVSTGLTTEDI